MNKLFDEIIEKFSPIIELKKFQKGEILHKANSICLKIFLVKTGVLRSYYFVNDKDFTAHFAMDYGVIGAADSIIRNKKSRYNIEALEMSEVFILDYNEMETFLIDNPSLERLARKFTQLIYIDLVERLEGIMFLTAKEKYEHLIFRFPDLIFKVNLSYIASYLGITQETLSRVRAQY